MKRLVLRRIFKAPDEPKPLQAIVSRPMPRMASTFAMLSIGQHFRVLEPGYEGKVFVRTAGNGAYRVDDGSYRDRLFHIDTLCEAADRPPAVTPFHNLRIGTVFRTVEGSQPCTKVSSTRIQAYPADTDVTHHMDAAAPCLVIRGPNDQTSNT